MTCKFCEIVHGARGGEVVYEDEVIFGFLDIRPVFPGHTLLIPKEHVETLSDLPERLLKPLFASAQLICRALEVALGAEGSFVAVNNRVSQSVPHLHVHIVPRRRKDGLKGFFWPRQTYKDAAETAAVAGTLRAAIERLKT